ncbi:hypothetical protein HanXRQr2_Chr08g0317561 [Helianthus annuus]|uniref:Uncharacterized protein n=1 Tax=Helianthus annuus TaxID=4232 RepID=A0A9K3IAY9_HELAN|nr:hypothetical protein HanXRQr2_Chr08g0317561 [Helianthus annuus]
MAPPPAIAPYGAGKHRPGGRHIPDSGLLRENYNGAIRFLMQVIGYVGITYASATEATTIFNLVPGFPFLFAIIFRYQTFIQESLT